MNNNSIIGVRNTTPSYTGEFDAKAMLLSNVGKKMRYRDRMEVELLQDTQYMKAGKIFSPAKHKGQALIDQGLARKVRKAD